MLRVLICLLYDFPHDYQKAAFARLYGAASLLNKHKLDIRFASIANLFRNA